VWELRAGETVPLHCGPRGRPRSPATGPGRAPEDAARSGGGGEVEWEVVSDKDGVDVTFPEALTDRALAAFCAP